MPIRVSFPREPSPRSTEGTLRVIKGRAYDQLKVDLERYCEGRIAGRSFVVSGHRGAGKTTLILALIEEIRARGPTRRPLLVHLSAPDLYTRLGAPAAPDVTGERLLIHITRQLHLAAAGEFAGAYREHAVEGAKESARAELLAAAGQLSIELGAGARLDAMRRFWVLAGRTERGVLYDEPPVPDQGVRELIALESSAEAFQIAIGQLKAGSTRETKESAPAATDWSEVLRTASGPAAALLTGTAAGFGVASRIPDVNGAIAGVGAGLLVAIALTRSIFPVRTWNRNDKYDFEPDTSVGSLAWRLPHNIDLLFQANLAPVFVIDELDKRVPR